jgi:hypothetical protein
VHDYLVHLVTGEQGCSPVMHVCTVQRVHAQPSILRYVGGHRGPQACRAAVFECALGLAALLTLDAAHSLRLAAR